VSIPTVLAAVLQASVGVWFLSAAFAKIADLPSARSAATAYSVISNSVAHRGVPVLVVTELMIGASLLTGIGIFVGSIIAVALLIGYAALMAIDLSRGLAHECGCGRVGALISWRAVVRNLGVASAISATAFVAPAWTDVPRHLILGLSVVSLWILTLELLSARRAAPTLLSRG
jgi:hypothetical protein